MAIEDILRALDEQGAADCAACVDEARAHAAQILDEAERKAAEIAETHAHNVEKTARAEAMKQVNAARLQGRMKISGVRGEGLDGAFSEARRSLAVLHESSQYSALFKALAAEALVGLEGPIKIRVAVGDVDLARGVAAGYADGAEVTGDLASAGGIVIEAAEGRIIRRNTLEDRLERVRPYIEADVAKVLLA